MPSSPVRVTPSGLLGLAPAAAAVAVAVAVWLAPVGRAEAQVVWQFDALSSLTYTVTDRQDTTENLVALEVRPALTLELGTSRWAFLARYLFAGTIGLNAPSQYSNQVSAAASAALSPRATLGLSASVLQGGVAFQLSVGNGGGSGLRAGGLAATARVEGGQNLSWELSPSVTVSENLNASYDILSVSGTGSPFGAIGNANRLNLIFGQGLGWQAGQDVLVTQALNARYSGGIDYLDRANVGATLNLTAQRIFATNTFGASLSSALDRTFLITELEGDPQLNLTSTLTATWGRALGLRWRAEAQAGAAQAARLGNDARTVYLPAGSFQLVHATDTIGITARASTGAQTNFETGTVNRAHQASLVAGWTIDPIRERALVSTFSYTSSSPLEGDVPDAGSGEALGADLALTWRFHEQWSAAARYGLAYQLFDFADEGQLVHIVLAGVTFVARSRREQAFMEDVRRLQRDQIFDARDPRFQQMFPRTRVPR